MADRFYPKGHHPHNLLTTIANLIATKSARASAPQSRIAPELAS
jgi:hypothetical protein